MITIGAVRTALLSPDPYTEMDRLVRSELGTGRTTQQITDDFRPIIDTALHTPGLSGEAEEAFLSTLDALTGNCHPDQCYEDPPNTTLPTEEEIATLPRWARVAFAARCARRVLPLFTRYQPNAPMEYLGSMKQAVGGAEHAAATAPLASAISTIAVAAADAAAENAVTAMATVAVRIADASKGAGTVSTAGTTAAKDGTAALTAATVAATVAISSRSHIRRDFDHLSRLAEAQRWDDDTPVPPDVFGPLWPEGAPKEWPPITDVSPRAELVIEGFAREQAAHQVIVDDIVNLFHALNHYHITRSGERLTLDQFHSLLPALVPAEV